MQNETRVGESLRFIKIISDFIISLHTAKTAKNIE